MPSRVIRGEILTSRSLSRVSELAEAMFARLLNLVDDYGRYDGDPEVLAAHLYPRRRSVTADMVEERLEELVNADGPGVGPVLLYEIEGRRYLQLINWERLRGKSKRGKQSRWPEPPSQDPQGARDLPPVPADPRGRPRIPARGSGVAGCRGDGVAGRDQDLPPDAAPPRDPDESPSGDELQRLAERNHVPLANCLAKLKGSPEEKRLWLDSGVGAEILAAADEELPEAATAKQRSGFLVRVTTQRWKAYLKTERLFEGKAEIQRLERLEAARGRAPPEDPAANGASYDFSDPKVRRFLGLDEEPMAS